MEVVFEPRIISVLFHFSLLLPLSNFISFKKTDLRNFWVWIGNLLSEV